MNSEKKFGENDLKIQDGVKRSYEKNRIKKMKVQMQNAQEWKISGF